MTAAPATTAPAATTPGGASPVAVRSWKAPIAFAIFTVIAILLFFVVGRPDLEGGNPTTTYRLSEARDAIQLPPLTLGLAETTIVVVLLMVAATVGAFLLSRAAIRVPLWLTTVFAVLFLVGFLTWAAAGATVPLIGLLAGALTVSTPLIFGSLGGVISERVGVVNIAIEGQLLGGAFMAAMLGSLTGSPYVGLLGAMVAGA
ncbi:MAG: ABC transporter permease subunit, partial [Actinomycetes bacterium]